VSTEALLATATARQVRMTTTWKAPSGTGPPRHGEQPGIADPGPGKTRQLGIRASSGRDRRLGPSSLESGCGCDDETKRLGGGSYSLDFTCHNQTP